MGNPITHETATAIIAISAVNGPRRRIISETESPRQNDTPILPVKTSFIQSAY